MIPIDGANGGGQVLRTALALSALTKQPFEMLNIRAGRPKPGLRPQHVACVKAAAEICQASYENAEVGSASVKFIPRDIKNRTLSIDIGTAGSITLLLQSLLLPVLFGKFRIVVKGGSDVPFSPPSDYFSEVLMPHLRKFAEKLEYKVAPRGFFPKGQGNAELIIREKFSGSYEEILKKMRADPTTSINLLNQGRLLQVKGTSIASSGLKDVAERQAESARLHLMKLNVPVHIESSRVETASTGSVVALRAIFSDSDEVSQINPVILGSSSLGERGRKAEDVGKEAALRLANEISSKAPVDSHLADQLLPFLALAGGKIRVPGITPHCKANIYVIEKFLGKCFEIEGNVITAK